MTDLMVTEHPEQKVCRLIERYGGGRDDPAFRNDFRAILDAGRETGALTEEEAALLKRARDLVETWSDPELQELFVPEQVRAEWDAFYSDARERISESVIECVLRKFPAVDPGAIDWSRYLLDDVRPGLIEVLLSRRMVRKEDIIRLSEERPTELYDSVLLDVLLQRGGSLPEAMWQVVTDARPRSGRRMSPDQVALRAFMNERSKAADRHIVNVLSTSEALKGRLFRAVLTHRATAIRLCRALISAAQAKGKKHVTGASCLLKEWAGECESAMRTGGATGTTASLVTAHIRLAALSATGDRVKGSLKEADDAAVEAFAQGALAALRRSEGDESSRADDPVLLLRASELYPLLQEYLRQLPAGGGGEAETPERAIRFERFQGSKMVLDEVIAALHDVPGESELHDAVEVAIFNSGVRPLGRIGERVLFDVHAHQPSAPGILQGDPCVIIEQGRILGGNEDGVVLVKATVRPVE